MMNLRKSLIWGGYVLFFMIAFPLVGVLQHRTFAQNPADRSDLRDRVAIQEKLLYAYAYAWDSKDCVGWANLFTADAVVSTAIKATGRDALLQACIERQKNVVDATKTRHNMINIVFDQLTVPTENLINGQFLVPHK
jgi:hypothetical protein